eukprot:CAMPEP_0184643610 /NCGR_PEP_ID=MMETSP0308-20130426/437_1 /TAXON_ID=38269 /ORGANISM="Gloeochaete witrockiana, Strain SAG 46.84" /LENGTH=131 /DNA_ID=CAMNT_0027071653 /DNA_START=1312 /DNA_END=1706 /DNA_ORIENTATION=-
MSSVSFFALSSLILESSVDSNLMETVFMIISIAASCIGVFGTPLKALVPASKTSQMLPTSLGQTADETKVSVKHSNTPTILNSQDMTDQFRSNQAGEAGENSDEDDDDELKRQHSNGPLFWWPTEVEVATG